MGESCDAPNFRLVEGDISWFSKIINFGNRSYFDHNFLVLSPIWVHYISFRSSRKDLQLSCFEFSKF